MNKPKAFCLALVDTLKEEGPGLIGKVVKRHARRLVRHNAPQPASPWLSKRIVEGVMKNKLNSVHSKVQTLPPEFEGHKEIERIIVYHEADRVGPHVEWYLVINGQAFNLGVKRLTPDMQQNVRYNREGKLTADSKQHLLDIVRTEFEGSKGTGSWLAQTTDHLPEEAREQWWNRDDPYHKTGDYGAGKMREVILDSTVDLHKVGRTSGDGVSVEWRDWDLNPYQDAYAFCAMQEGPNRSKNILKLGFKKEEPPNLHGKLKLKPHIGKDKLEKLREKAGEDALVTIKEDGAAAHFLINKKGMRLWSHRESKLRGTKISYTGKVKDLRHLKSKENIVGMGELLYRDTKTGKILSASEIGGLLNSNKPIPDHIEPEFMIYRIDRIGRKTLAGKESGWENLEKIKELTEEVSDDRVRPPTVVTWNKAKNIYEKHEGLVVTPKQESIFNGHKFKHRPETQDGIITEITFQPGSKGGIEGVICYQDDKTGKKYKLSSGFTKEQKLDMMNNKDKYIGRVMVLNGYAGHSGRGAKFSHWHQDKGVSDE